MVLDVFAGTGALGLEALSRGAASACFIELDPVSLRALRANIAACRAEDRTEVLAVDVLTGAVGRSGKSADVVFLDPPYGLDLIAPTLVRLREVGRIAPVRWLSWRPVAMKPGSRMSPCWPSATMALLGWLLFARLSALQVTIHRINAFLGFAGRPMVKYRCLIRLAQWLRRRSRSVAGGNRRLPDRAQRPSVLRL